MYCILYHFFEAYDKNVPLLKCGDYMCPKYNCDQKSNKINECPCGAKLIRGCRKYEDLKLI